MDTTPWQPWFGKINDADSHLQLPARMYPEILGPVGEMMKTSFERFFDGADMREHFDPAQEAAHSHENIWRVKGAAAPGSSSVEGRIKTLDMMGIDRQLIFPQVVLCMLAWSRSGKARETRDRYNEFAGEWCRQGRGRLRTVGLVGTEDLDAACSEAHQLVSTGVSAVLVPEGRLVGGLSPADPRVDRFWSVFAEANIPVLIHVGGGLDYPSSTEWGETDILQAGGAGAGEVVSPYLLGVLQHAAENYIVTLTLGGVFERIPTLRFGAIELGASWFGPMAERMEMIVEMGLGKEIRKFSLRPSEFLRRNVRVTPFIVEDVGLMVERYGLEETYAFSTDFPHPEGGSDPLQRMTSSLGRHGSGVLEQFLVTNSELLMPA